ncbi:hypothetical protein B5X24_HaOG215846 [Helicoverpa armigera]|nr:hypothetical protein B5X24_HaOG215846 [Helicoverpa armigera]
MPWTGNNLSAKWLMERIVCVVIIFNSIILESEQSMPWDRWSWSMPQQPIEYFFRRSNNLPMKSPSFDCDCPPHNECVVEFKINKDMADFLSMRGVIKDENLKEFREDLTKLEQSEGTTKDILSRVRGGRSRRSNAEGNCCCPPRNVYMPTFITDKKYEELASKLKQQQ